MSNKVTQAERELIADLLRDGFTVPQAAVLTGRGQRTVYYVKSEMKRNTTESYTLKKGLRYLAAFFTGGDLYEKSQAGESGAKGRA